MIPMAYNFTLKKNYSAPSENYPYDSYMIAELSADYSFYWIKYNKILLFSLTKNGSHVFYSKANNSFTRLGKFGPKRIWLVNGKWFLLNALTNRSKWVHIHPLNGPLNIQLRVLGCNIQDFLPMVYIETGA